MADLIPHQFLVLSQYEFMSNLPQTTRKERLVFKEGRAIKGYINFIT